MASGRSLGWRQLVSIGRGLGCSDPRTRTASGCWSVFGRRQRGSNGVGTSVGLLVG